MDEAYKQEKKLNRLSVFDKYEFEGKIGSGSYGVVYKATSTNKEDTKEYAIKKLKVSTSSEEGLNMSACREITLCRELEHENIVHLREVLLDPLDRSIYLVYDYAEHDLLQLIQWYRSMRIGMPEEMIKSIMWQLLNGVAYLHANWVLHRDIKPANILIMGKGPQMGILKIADLGLGRLYLAPLVPLSSMDKTIVTIWYRAPELLLKAKHYTKAVDIWSVGCVFGELFKLRPLFKGVEEKPDHTNRSPFQKEQLTKIFDVLGFPDKSRWSNVDELPEAPRLQNMKTLQKSQLGAILQFVQGDGWSQKLQISNMESATKLMSRMLEFDPIKRISAEEALNHSYFQENPQPKMNCLACFGDKIERIKRSITTDEEFEQIIKKRSNLKNDKSMDPQKISATKRHRLH